LEGLNKSNKKVNDDLEELKTDAVASVIISPDKLKAFIVLNPPEEEKMLKPEEILELLNKNGVTYGIKNSTIDSIVKSPVYNEMICVAEGKPPIPGQNGSIEYHFDIKKERKPTVLEDGRVDFRELNLIENVSKGQVLCTLIPPVPGIKGKTVTGEDIPTVEGKPAILPKGRNVEVSED